MGKGHPVFEGMVIKISINSHLKKEKKKKNPMK